MRHNKKKLTGDLAHKIIGDTSFPVAEKYSRKGRMVNDQRQDYQDKGDQFTLDKSFIAFPKGQIGAYMLDEFGRSIKLGEGSYGKILRLSMKLAKRRVSGVALKVAKFDENPSSQVYSEDEVREMLSQEQRLMYEFHTNSKPLSAPFKPNSKYKKMAVDLPLLFGTEICTYLKNNPDLSYLKRLELLLDAAIEIRRFHKYYFSDGHRYIHNDLKWENMLFDPDAKKRRVKLLDMAACGKARFQLAPRQFTPDFIAPEAMRQRCNVDRGLTGSYRTTQLSDVFAFAGMAALVLNAIGVADARAQKFKIKDFSGDYAYVFDNLFDKIDVHQKEKDLFICFLGRMSDPGPDNRPGMGEVVSFLKERVKVEKHREALRKATKKRVNKLKTRMSKYKKYLEKRMEKACNNVNFKAFVKIEDVNNFSPDIFLKFLYSSVEDLSVDGESLEVTFQDDPARGGAAINKLHTTSKGKQLIRLFIKLQAVERFAGELSSQKNFKDISDLIEKFNSSLRPSIRKHRSWSGRYIGFFRFRSHGKKVSCNAKSDLKKINKYNRVLLK